ncbi:exosortase B [Massilia sp. YIM B04103]|uniref:exosortase B n=1 Tax=Massilia sp. YIM B04103 TaxID=2963106 RepID=UPI00210E131B|nr:exosortase B [Massilia sp. YIM B04103]
MATMSKTFSGPGVAAWRGGLAEWLPLALGLLALYLPTLNFLLHGIWATEEQAHGPIILALSLWLMWRAWPAMWARTRPEHGTAAGWPLLLLALLIYVVGRSQQLIAADLLSLILLLMACLLLKRGWAAVRLLWFPFFFMLFMVPLPAQLVITLTMPMKMAVSYAVEHLLFAAGYPIARTGVILQIGQYQLLVADACAGLQTLLSLEALGLFYLNVVRHTAPLRNIALALLIIPISFSANVVRVIVLTLVTYYLGDAAGQGFLHGFAGMVLFVTALCLILLTDSVLQWCVRLRAARKGQVAA